ncbi:MAG: prepilin-type N-terminal cleavage/methylation domain-containing protein, partial [Gammaproteobacteria bacterium]|nr:prepilin-type N-terminal cleavage/methylation domain-containing protein [Gammaproteobacteria bacterium]
MKQRGATLVELMIALAIGAIVVAAVTTLLFQTKKNYTIQDSMARLQENARFAMQFIVRDLRMAGYFGCMDDVTSVFNHVDGGAGSLFDGGSPIDGYEQGDDDWRPSGSTAQISSIVSGTDAIALRYLDGAGNIPIEEPYMPNVSAALHLAANNGLKKGDVIAVTDCSSADIFQITGP